MQEENLKKNLPNFSQNAKNKMEVFFEKAIFSFKQAIFFIVSDDRKRQVLRFIPVNNNKSTENFYSSDGFNSIFLRNRSR